MPDHTDDKITVPLWPLLLMLITAVVVGLILGATGSVLAGFSLATVGWLTGLAEAASRGKR